MLHKLEAFEVHEVPSLSRRSKFDVIIDVAKT